MCIRDRNSERAGIRNWRTAASDMAVSERGLLGQDPPRVVGPLKMMIHVSTVKYLYKPTITDDFINYTITVMKNQHK